MNIKSFYHKGFQIDILAEKLTEDMMRATVYVNGSKVNDSDLDIPEAEIEETADRIESLLKKNLSI